MSRNIGDDIFGSRKKTINQKRKGNTNERVAAKWLERWTGKKFTRVPSSGGLRWKAGNSSVCGDVVCTDHTFDFPFSVETKFLKDFALKATMSGRSKVKTLWKQAVADAKRAGKEPFLMLRKNQMGKGEYVVFVSGFIGCIILKQFGVIQTNTVMDRGVMLFGFDSEQLINVDYNKFVCHLKNE